MSYYIHIAPALVVLIYKSTDGLTLFEVTENVGLIEYSKAVVGLYLIWAIPYYIVKFHLTRYIWDTPEYSCLFKDILESKGLLGNILRSVPRKYQAETYMLEHLVTSYLEALIVYPALYSYTYLSTITIGLLLYTIFNGANYYIEVFPRRYSIELKSYDDAAYKKHD